jgi:Domain of unknown function (DUF4157)
MNQAHSRRGSDTNRAVVSPRAESEAQGPGRSPLQTLLDQAPRTQRLATLSRDLNARPVVIAQRKLAQDLNARPVVIAQRKLARDLANRPPTSAARAGLPAPLKSGIEALSGLAMDSVQVHYNSSAPEQLNAHAFAQGTDIHLAPGQEAHLPHEAWHVVQQSQGRVAPRIQLAGTGINDDPGLEREADLMGQRATRLPPIADGFCQRSRQQVQSNRNIGSVTRPSGC